MINLSVYDNPSIYRKWKASDHFERLGRLPSRPLEKYEEGHTRLDIEFLAKLSAPYAPLSTYKLRIRNRIVFFTRDELIILLKYYYVKNVYQDEYGQFYFISWHNRRHNERTYLFKPFRTIGRFIYCGMLMNDSSLSNIRFVLADPNDLFTVTFDELRLLVTFDAVNELCLVNDMILLYYTDSYGWPTNIDPLVEVYPNRRANIHRHLYTVNPYTGTLIPSGKFSDDLCYRMEEAPKTTFLDSSVLTSAFFKEMKDRKIYVKNIPVEMASFLIRNPHSTQKDFFAHDYDREHGELFTLFCCQYRAAGKKPYKQLSF